MPPVNNESVLPGAASMATSVFKSSGLQDEHVQTLLAQGTLGSSATAGAAAAPAAPAADPPAAPGDDKFDQLVQLLNASASPPATQVASGLAPAPTSIVIKPDASYAKDNILNNYNALQNMASMITLYSGILDIQLRKQQNHPEQYKITDPVEAMMAFENKANEAYQAMTGPLAGFYNFSQGASTSFSKSMTRTEFHAGFLGEIFKGFNLSDDTLTQLDTILTNFAQSVGSIQIEASGAHKSVNNTILVHTCPAVNASGDPKDPVWVYQPTTTLIYLEVDLNAWQTVFKSKSGSSTTDHFDFSMVYTVTKCQLNMEAYQNSVNKFNQIIQFVTGKNLEAFGATASTSVTDSSLNATAGF
ncbi:hypothetical protein TWF281_003242 [Arthrobotrys megalospora]